MQKINGKNLENVLRESFYWTIYSRQLRDNLFERVKEETRKRDSEDTVKMIENSGSETNIVSEKIFAKN